MAGNTTGGRFGGPLAPAARGLQSRGVEKLPEHLRPIVETPIVARVLETVPPHYQAAYAYSNAHLGTTTSGSVVLLTQTGASSDAKFIWIITPKNATQPIVVETDYLQDGSADLRVLNSATVRENLFSNYIRHFSVYNFYRERLEAFTSQFGTGMAASVTESRDQPMNLRGHRSPLGYMENATIGIVDHYRALNTRLRPTLPNSATAEVPEVRGTSKDGHATYSITSNLGNTRDGSGTAATLTITFDPKYRIPPKSFDLGEMPQGEARKEYGQQFMDAWMIAYRGDMLPNMNQQTAENALRMLKVAAREAAAREQAVADFKPRPGETKVSVMREYSRDGLPYELRALSERNGRSLYTFIIVARVRRNDGSVAELTIPANAPQNQRDPGMPTMEQVKETAFLAEQALQAGVPIISDGRNLIIEGHGQFAPSANLSDVSNALREATAAAKSRRSDLGTPLRFAEHHPAEDFSVGAVPQQLATNDRYIAARA